MNLMRTTALVAVVLLLQVVCVSALSADEARLTWLDAKGHTAQAIITHEDAKLQRAANNTPENRQAVVDTGKVLQYAMLDEAQAWLTWKNLSVQEDPLVSDELKQTISADVQTNFDKITELRGEVDNVTNEFELGVVSLKMIGKYVELLTDVARNVGLIWAHTATVYADRIDDFQARLRTTAQSVNASQDVLAKLDAATSEVQTARTNIGRAEAAYNLVVLPGNPFLKFAEGNSYLRAAQANMLVAVADLNQAYVMITTQAGV